MDYQSLTLQKLYHKLTISYVLLMFLYVPDCVGLFDGFIRESGIAIGICLLTNHQFSVLQGGNDSIIFNGMSGMISGELIRG